MRKRILSIVVCFLLFAPQVYGYTVTLDFLNTSLISPISGLEFDFLGSTAGDDFPLDMNWDTFQGDFSVSLGSAVVVPAGWNTDTLISSVGNSDYVNGMSFSAKAMNTTLAPVDGLFATMGSDFTDFGIDLTSFVFFDFTGTYGEIITTPFSVAQTADGSGLHVLVDFAPASATVPIPGAVWLLASGLFGLVTIRRRRG